MFVRIQVCNNDGEVIYQQVCPPRGLTQWNAEPAQICADGDIIGRITLDVRPGFTPGQPSSFIELARALADQDDDPPDSEPFMADQDDDPPDSDLESDLAEEPFIALAPPHGRLSDLPSSDPPF